MKSRSRSIRPSGRLAAACAALWMTFPLAAAGPNLVVIFADDLGWNDVGYHGSEIATPRIDALARQGVELDRYYAFPLCSPTRAAFLTGRSPIRLGVDGPIEVDGRLDLDEHLLPETLRAAGYQTFLAGKWHLGMDVVAAHPHRRGFDRAYGHLGPSVDYYTHVWAGGLDWHRDGEALREDGYSTDLIPAEAVRMIAGRDPERPMFLYVAFNAPHTPLQAPDEYLRRYAAIEDPGRRTYAAMVAALDAGVGTVVDALDDAGIADDTLLVWASDNGGGRNASGSNVPLQGAKGGAFEGGVRVPALIRWPGVLPAGAKFGRMLTATDWFPTLASALGVEARNREPFDGVDMWPALKDGAPVARGETILGANRNYAIFRDGWKLVLQTRRGPARTGAFLFRIEDDPFEGRDLAAQEPELVRDLRARVLAFPRPPGAGPVIGPGSPEPPGRPGRRPGGGGRPAARGDGETRETRPPWVETAADRRP